MSAMETVLITGANAGLGRDSARQAALLSGVKKVYLACRSEARGEAAKAELEAATGKDVFEVVRLDTSDLDVVAAAVDAIDRPIDGLVLNAGGPLGPSAGDKTRDGVVLSMAANVLGHVALVDGLIAAGKLRGTVVFVSTEAVRGIPAMGFARPDLKHSSVEEFVSIADGSYFKSFDAMKAYGPIKYVGTLWTSAMARRHPAIRFISVSPGATTGTNAANELNAFQRFMFKYVAFPVMKAIGRAHDLSSGAERYLAVLTDEKYESGKFYASPWPSTSGELVDQTPLFEDLADEQIQDNAFEAVQRFLPVALAKAA